MALCPSCKLEVGYSKFCPYCGVQVIAEPVYYSDGERYEQTEREPWAYSYDPTVHNAGQETYSQGYQQPYQQQYQQPRQQPQYQVIIQPVPQQPPAKQDDGSVGWAVLGFFIPIVGLILFLVWRSSKPKSARSAAIGAAVSIVCLIVLYAFTFCAIIASSASASL